MKFQHRLRIRLILTGIFIAVLVLVSALYYRQISNGGTYLAKANKQYIRPAQSLFDRGSIYFTSKDGHEVLSATIGHGNLLYMNPSAITEPKETYETLSQYVTLDKNAFLDLANKKSVTYVELLHRLTDEVALPLTNLNLLGVGVGKESWRSYPGDELASHVLGLVGQDQGTSTIVGKYGLERYYQDVLDRPKLGSSGSVIAQLFTGVRDTVLGGDHKQGDIVTTIEPTVEGYLEKILSETNQIWHPDEIGGIIINPKTGEIYAMSSLPSFNANDTSKIKDASVFSNPLVEHVYEMGSIVKPITLAVGLDSGAIDKAFTYDDTGSMTLNKKTIRNYDGKPRGITDLQQILSQSLNVGAATVGLKIGGVGMYSYFSSLGLSDKTGIDLPVEAKGIIGNIKSGRDIDVATASYGQGIAVSPIEVTKALSILANGGKNVMPHVVKKINYSDGTSHNIPLGDGKQVLRAETSRAITDLLVKVVDEALKKGAIKMDLYTIAAKTGTAQIADRVNGGYYSDRYLHSFFGYFPAYDPQFLVFLYQIYPKGAEYASETLTNPFDQLAKFLINYYSVVPDRDLTKSKK